MAPPLTWDQVVDALAALEPLPGHTLVWDGSTWLNQPTPLAEVTGPLTDEELRSAPVPVTGTVAVSNPPASPETGLAKDATFAKHADGGIRTHVENFPATQAVTGAFFPATQPVSGSVAVSNLPATQPVSGSVSVANFPAAQPITDNNGSLTVDGTVAVSNFPATQPVSGSVAVSNLPATQPVSGSVSVSNLPATQPVSGSVAVSNLPAQQQHQPSPLAVSATGAAAAAVTLTLPAAGAGLSHYITRLEVVAYNSAARTGSATPVIVTSTNLPGSYALTFPSAGAIGTTETRVLELGSAPLKSAAANTATTIVGPATAGIIWRINVTYYTAA